MSEKLWLKSYPDYVSHQLPLLPFLNLAEFLEQNCLMFKNHIAFSHFQYDVTYGEVWQLSLQFAAYLQQKLNIQKGDKLAIMMPNCLNYPVALFASYLLGAVVVNVNPLYKSEELLHQLNDAEVTAILVLDICAEELEKIIQQTAIKIIITASLADLLPRPKSWLVRLAIKLKYNTTRLGNERRFKDCLDDGANLTFKKVDVGLSDLACLQYTAGTTGLAKGAMLSHGNILSNIAQVDSWVMPNLETGKEVNILALPLYHIFSLTVNLLAMTRIGVRNIIITNPKDFKSFIKTLKQYPFSLLTAVNTLFVKLLKDANFQKLNFNTLKLAIGGGMAVQESVAKDWKALTGKPILQGYGLSETSPVVCVNKVGDEFNGSIGLPLPGVDIAFFNNDDEQVPQGEVGELGVKGPQVMQGYWKRESGLAFNKQNFFMTGDVGYLDENGYVFLKARKKELIIVSGFNVYPGEVEACLDRHADILESAVIGVSSEDSGEQVKAFVVSSNAALTSAEVISWCKMHLANYKVPRQIVFKTELPKSPVGKILKKDLLQ